MDLPSLTSLRFKDKKVLLRLDLDVPVGKDKDTDKDVVLEQERLYAALPTFKYLIEQQAKQITVLGHKGRPQGKVDETLSLKPVGKRLEEILKEELGEEKLQQVEILLNENLRFDPGEEANDLKFAKNLAKQGDVYINDAFGVCHRESASIVGLPKLLPHAAGIHLQEEVNNLERVLINPKEPVVFIIGGGKPDKTLLIERLLDQAEFVLVGGVVAKYIQSYCRGKDGRMCIVAAHLTLDGKDITPDSVTNFIKVIDAAETIVWNGPMGDVDNNYWESTQIVADAVAKSDGYKVVGGGDTIHALEHFGLLGKIDYISMGGGAMLEFLAYGDLPGLAVLRQK